MTEAEWLASVDPESMLGFLRTKTSHRKLRLFATACCCRAVHIISDERIRRIVDASVDASDEYADRRLGADHLDYECLVAETARRWENKGLANKEFAVLEALELLGSNVFDPHWASIRISEAIGHIAFDSLDTELAWRPADPAEPDGLAYGGQVADEARGKERAAQAALLREILGNPFRPAKLTIDAVWRTTTAVQLSQGMYDSRDFAAMPILADALQDAGCDDADILDHCRGPGPHVRGCWVVDLVLGKE